MFVIIAHHYVVNSGLMNEIQENPLANKSIFLLLFGWGGKYGINCFVLITGYYMCQSHITIKKYLKLFLEVEFYNIIIYILFFLTGYTGISIKELIKTILPIYGVGTGFTNSYLVFFWFIPFINILIKAMNEKQYVSLLTLCLLVFTIIPTFCKTDIIISYITWFIIIYMIGGYMRLYPKKWYDNNKIWCVSTMVLLLFSLLSVMLCVWISTLLDKQMYYYFVNDSNKIFALAPALTTFMFFKNLKLRYSKIINCVAASTFGVLMIHANSDDMRQWLWKDILNNVEMYNSEYLVIHAILSVTGIYIICTIIDMVRI